MMQERISKVYTQTRNVLNALYEKRKRTLLFQKIMWGITGIYFVWMLLVLAAPYFQGYENGPLAFVEQFQSTPSNPYGSMYPIIGLIVLLYPTTLIFTRVFQKYTQKEQEIIAKMVKTLFPKGYSNQCTYVMLNQKINLIK